MHNIGMMIGIMQEKIRNISRNVYLPLEKSEKVYYNSNRSIFKKEGSLWKSKSN